MENQISAPSLITNESADGTGGASTEIIVSPLQSVDNAVNLSPSAPNPQGLSSDEKLGDSYENINKKPKGKKRKKAPRDMTAPRQPLTGYVRYLNERREKARTENPTMSFSDLTRLMALEWGQMPTNQKQQYLDAAEVDKERYFTEMNAYKQTEAYKIFTQKQTEKKKSHIKVPAVGEIDLDREPFVSTLEVPVFTEEFLDMNKARETELRNLRKSNIDLEQQNAVLQKHIDDMKVAVDKLEADTAQAHTNNQALGNHLQQLRASLASSFSQFPLPGEKDGANLATIDAYMTRLDCLLQDAGNGDTLACKVREIVSRMELHG